MMITIMIIINSKGVTSMVRHSKQRDAILSNLCSRYDHPSAEDIYLSLKPEMPAISLATVYRNLAQLETDGKIIRVGSGGTARYDGNISPHYHLSCLKCGSVVDIFMDDDSGICEKAAKIFDGTIISHSVLFTGYCSGCSTKLG
jgi:Fur family peroxide stress response transcriptional regulator